ncbi:uncharacterized protein TNCV_725631 [Trichonephila clavipes]|nr:uncharacterized protein TNCV_725631 [Trichonephila clavipes]
MLSGGVVSGGTCTHDMNPERREKQDGSLPPDPGLRSPGSSSTALSLVEFRPSMKSASSGQTEQCRLPLRIIPRATCCRGCGSPVVKVSNHGRHVMSSIPVPLKTRRVGQRCTLNLSRAETSSVGVVW